VLITPAVSHSLNGPLTGYFVSIVANVDNNPDFTFRHDNRDLPSRFVVSASSNGPALDGTAITVVIGNDANPLQSYMSYIILVEPFNELDISGRQENLIGGNESVILVTLPSQPTANVTNLAVIETNDVASTPLRNLKATWSLPPGPLRNGIITSFTLTYALQAPTGLSSVVTTAVNGGSGSINVPALDQGKANFSAEFEIVGLAAAATYRFTVVAINDASSNNISPPASVYPSTTPYQPTGPVDNLDLSASRTGLFGGTESRISVAFNRPLLLGRNGASSRYTVAVQQVDSQYARETGQTVLGTLSVDDSGINAQSFDLDGSADQPRLEAFVEYKITVTPFNLEPASPGPAISKTVRAEKLVPGQVPTGVAVPTVLADRLVVSWSAIATHDYNDQDSSVTYALKFTRISRSYLAQDGTEMAITTLSNTSTNVPFTVTQVSFDGLLPYTQYTVDVRAKNSVVRGCLSMSSAFILLLA
jgi:hypothetical protein